MGRGWLRFYGRGRGRLLTKDWHRLAFLDEQPPLDLSILCGWTLGEGRIDWCGRFDYGAIQISSPSSKVSVWEKVCCDFVDNEWDWIIETTLYFIVDVTAMLEALYQDDLVIIVVHMLSVLSLAVTECWASDPWQLNPIMSLFSYV